MLAFAYRNCTRASSHWMRDTHAPHVLVHGAELTKGRDNLRHMSASKTLIYRKRGLKALLADVKSKGLSRLLSLSLTT